MKIYLRSKNNALNGLNTSEFCCSRIVFYPLFCSAYRSGEKSGRLSESLEEISPAFRKLFEQKVHEFTQFINFAIMFFIGFTLFAIAGLFCYYLYVNSLTKVYMLKTTLYLLAFFAISVLHSKERKNIMLPYNELKHDLKKTVQKEIVFTNLRLPKIVYKGYQKGLKSDLEGIIEINGQSRIVKKGFKRIS